MRHHRAPRQLLIARLVADTKRTRHLTAERERLGLGLLPRGVLERALAAAQSALLDAAEAGHNGQQSQNAGRHRNDGDLDARRVPGPPLADGLGGRGVDDLSLGRRAIPKMVSMG